MTTVPSAINLEWQVGLEVFSSNRQSRGHHKRTYFFRPKYNKQKIDNWSLIEVRLNVCIRIAFIIISSSGFYFHYGSMHCNKIW